MNAFKQFEEDDSQSVAILHGNHGTFCSGADLKSFNNNVTNEDVDKGPMGPTRMLLVKKKY